jgi:hypothetical protein
MAHTTLVGMLREDGAAKSMGAVMKEIVSAMNAPEETRRVLREQIDEACNSKKTTESSRNAEEFKFKVPRHTLEGWKASLRAKRWVFTSFLASISGLADEEEIKKLEKTAENLRHVEIDNAEEIVKLESKSNEIVERISKQNERLTKLFKDEQGLNSKLQDIMSEDASISRQLSSTVRSLEVVADLNLEYSMLSSIIELIPVLLTECRTVVHSLYDGILPNEILEAAWKKGSINKDTAKHVYSEVWIQHDIIAVVYYVPDYAEFSLYRLDFLPVLVGTGKTCVRIDSKPYVTAISMDGQFFDYSGDNCTTDATSVVCSVERVTLRKSPKTCV